MNTPHIEENSTAVDSPSDAPAPRRRHWRRYAIGVLILVGGLGAAALLARPAPPPMLTDADLKYLQDAEHFGGFVLGDRALPLLAEALRDDDREALVAFFSESFEGRLFDDHQSLIHI